MIENYAPAPALVTDRVDDTTPTERLVPWILERFARQRIVMTTAFGMEGCVLIDLIARESRPLTVRYVDTGFFFPETLALRDRLAARYPSIRFEAVLPRETPLQQAWRLGPDLWRTNPDRCCALRKVQPMREALRDVDVWITGITRQQSESRGRAALIAWDPQFQLLKINPLIRWDRRRVWDHIREHDVPYNELHERGYPTVGCTHCTRPVEGVQVTEYTRLGRWSGTSKTECGLHVAAAS
jgi:phosphoadenosine phosphosulfate reductase